MILDEPSTCDAVMVMFLQRYSQAKRIYATVLYTKAQISNQSIGTLVYYVPLLIIVTYSTENTVISKLRKGRYGGARG